MTMKKVTLLQSNTLRMYLATSLMIVAASFHLYVTTAALLLAIGWYANKAFGALE